MPYQSSFSFDTVVVVESLRKGDVPTGTDLFETTIAPESLAQNIYAKLYHVSSPAELLAVLAETSRMALDGRSPIIHFEMHGDKDGLQLANDDSLKWAELAPALRKVNEETQMNLLVVASACHGWHISDILRPVDRAPAWAILGPPDSVEAGDLYAAMKRFYSRLLSTLNLREALDAMNNGHDIADWSYRIQSADLLYCHVFRHYMNSVLEEESHAERVNRLVADFARAQELDVSQTTLLRTAIGADLSNHEFWFDRYKTRFLMLDLFPDIAHRFPLGFQDCSNKAV